MKSSQDRASKRCLNAWFKFLAIFCVAAITMFVIFQFKIGAHGREIGRSDTSLRREPKGPILISVMDSGPTGAVAVQFEMCPIYLLATDSGGEWQYEYFSNDPTSYDLSTMQAFVKQERIQAVLTGTMEIGTHQMLSVSRVGVFTGVTGAVEVALQRLEAGELASFSRYYGNRRQSPFLSNAGNPKPVNSAAF